MIKAWMERRAKAKAERAAAEAAEDAVNPRCVCGHRWNQHLSFGTCGQRCGCYAFISKPRGS
jgi:hypothetical protein